MGLTVIKLSILCHFFRFLVTPIPRQVTAGFIIVIAVYGIVIFITSLCSCWPVAFFWNKSIEGGHCINLLAFWYTNATFNILTDAIVVGVPIHAFKDLRLPKRQKWGLVAVFALGGL